MPRTTEVTRSDARGECRGAACDAHRRGDGSRGTPGKPSAAVRRPDPPHRSGPQPVPRPGTGRSNARLGRACSRVRRDLVRASDHGDRCGLRGTKPSRADRPVTPHPPRAPGEPARTTRGCTCRAPRTAGRSCGHAEGPARRSGLKTRSCPCGPSPRVGCLGLARFAARLPGRATPAGRRAEGDALRDERARRGRPAGRAGHLKGPPRPSGLRRVRAVRRRVPRRP